MASHRRVVPKPFKMGAQRGLASLRFDFTGIGESEGDFTETDFSSNVGDLIKAAEFLERNYAPPRILIGH